MTTVPQYVNTFKSGFNTICTRLGSDPSGVNMQTQAIATSQMALLGVVVKTLVDKGIFTDAELVTQFNQAIADAWPQLPIA